MIKAVSFSLGISLLFVSATALPAQTTSATGTAVNQAVIDQANTIVLRQKLVEAKAAVSRGDLKEAAQVYEDAYSLVEQIGPSGIPDETAQTISGLVSTHMELARRAQQSGNLTEADAQVSRVLKVAPHNTEAIAFQKKNKQMIEARKGTVPDEATVARVPQITAEQTQAATLVQDGKLLYEMGKFEEAEVKLDQALKLDPDSQSGIYYLKLVKQADYARQEDQRTIRQQDAMVQVQQQWTPKVSIGLPVPNPYATNTDIHTSASRERIYNKLNSIHLDNISWPDGFPLSEIIRYLTEQSKVRDPEKKGINFLFNPNPNQESEANPNGTANAAAAAGPTAVNPQTGLPIAPTATSTGNEPVDPSTINVRLTLSDVSLLDALNAIVLVADHPIKYSVEDYGVVFSVKSPGPEQPQLEMRVFKVDPNTFYQGLQGVTSFTFGSANNNNSGNGSSGNSGNSGNNNNSGNGNGNGSSISGAIVPVVDVTGGGRNGNNGGGGGGGRNGGGGGTGSIIGGGGGAGGAGGGGGAGPLGGSGLGFVTTPGYMSSVSDAARAFFQAIGVDLTTPGRSIAFNDRLGLLFVKATPGELDTIERAIQALNQVPPQVHIKARFIEVNQDDNAALGFDWYLGNFINGRVVANGGSAPSLTVPVSAANPLGAFPGNTVASLIPGSSSDQLLTGGLRNTGPALATVTGILTDPNFRVVLHALEQRTGVETLAEPEVVTTSGRQTQMRATDIQYILTGFGFQQGNNNISTGTTGTTQ